MFHWFHTDVQHSTITESASCCLSVCLSVSDDGRDFAVTVARLSKSWIFSDCL